MAEDQKKLQGLSDAYQKLQNDLQATVTGRQKIESQQQENKGVQKEFSTLPLDSNIYKLVGPVLLKQERSEAVMAVEGRLEFIEKEIKRVEKQIQDMQDESETKKMEVDLSITDTDAAGPAMSEIYPGGMAPVSVMADSFSLISKVIKAKAIPLHYERRLGLRDIDDEDDRIKLST
ncbi:hypothetical protein MMC28_007387 [Mycoblastus sanguinarius]|nr:hypothetical protein [Mycoblastus sanguinarius]